VARSGDRATRLDRRSPVPCTTRKDVVETCGRRKWHGRETVPQHGFAQPRTGHVMITMMLLDQVSVPPASVCVSSWELNLTMLPVMEVVVPPLAV